MNKSPEDFEDIRKLLALKRHEAPPPGYFHYLPGQIISKIERGEQLAEHSTWWEWLVRRFDARPLLACTYGFAVTGLLVMGFRISQILGNETAPGAGGSWLVATTSDPTSLFSNDLLPNSLTPAVGLVTSSATAPSFAESPERFSRFGNRGFRIEKANFVVSP